MATPGITMFNNGETLHLMDQYPYYLLVKSPAHQEPLVLGALINITPEGIFPQLVLSPATDSPLFPPSPSWVYYTPPFTSPTTLEFQAPKINPSEQHQNGNYEPGIIPPAQQQMQFPLLEELQIQTIQESFLRNAMNVPVPGLGVHNGNGPPGFGSRTWLPQPPSNGFQIQGVGNSEYDAEIRPPDSSGSLFVNGYEAEIDIGSQTVTFPNRNCLPPQQMVNSFNIQDISKPSYNNIFVPSNNEQGSHPEYEGINDNLRASLDYRRVLEEGRQSPPSDEMSWNNNYPNNNFNSTSNQRQTSPRSPPTSNGRRGHPKGVKRYCLYCIKNGKPEVVSHSHYMKSKDGAVTICRYLREVKCPICQATGDVAHTANFCPLRKSRIKNNQAQKNDKENQESNEIVNEKEDKILSETTESGSSEQTPVTSSSSNSLELPNHPGFNFKSFGDELSLNLELSSSENNSDQSK